MFDVLQPSFNGGECQPRTYCPLASPWPTNCTAGQYCENAGLALPMGPCDQGWYCPEASETAREIVCPRGYYCPVGTDVPEPCR